MSRGPRHPRRPTGERAVALLALVACLGLLVTLGAAAPAALLTDHGGRVLSTPQVSAIYLGTYWVTGQGASEALHTDAFLQTWLSGPSITDVLAQYRVASARFTSSTKVSVAAPAQFTDTEAQTLVQQLIAAHLVVAGPEAVHVIYLPPGTVLTFQNVSSLGSLSGYHSSYIDATGAPVYYAVVVYNQTISDQVTNGIDFTGTPQDNATIVTSRVLAGAFTDPDVNVTTLGWLDDVNGEVGDVAFALSQDPARQDVFVLQNGFAVVLLWSNKDEKLTAGAGTTASATLLVAPGAQTATPGSTVTYTVTNPVTAVDTVTLTVSGLPTGATGTLAATSLAPGASTTLTVTVGSGAPLTTALFTVTGTGGTTALSATATLTISTSASQPPATAPTDFSVTVTPTSQDMVRGGPAAVYTITTTPAGSGPVRLKLKTQHVLGGLKAYLSTTRMVAGETATIEVTAHRDTQRKTYDFTLKISSDQADQRVPLTLTLR